MRQPWGSAVGRWQNRALRAKLARVREQRDILTLKA
jgi:hypothetical protein